MTETDPIQPLRMVAIRERLGQTIGSDQLIKAALDAILACGSWTSSAACSWPTGASARC